MAEKILYAGDTSLTTAASYLAGVLTSSGLDFDYLPSDQPIRQAISDSEHSLYIISDYPVNNWQEEDRVIASKFTPKENLDVIVCEIFSWLFVTIVLHRF